MLYIPCSIVFICPLLQINIGNSSAFITVSVAVYPAIDTLPNIFIIKNYNRATLGDLRILISKLPTGTQCFQSSFAALAVEIKILPLLRKRIQRWSRMQELVKLLHKTFHFYYKGYSPAITTTRLFPEAFHNLFGFCMYVQYSFISSIFLDETFPFVFCLEDIYSHPN